MSFAPLVRPSQRRPRRHAVDMVGIWWVGSVLLFGVGCTSNIEKPDLQVPASLPRVEATTSLGTLRGVQEDDVFAFYGVPYAAPFVGLQRFLPPSPPTPFAGIHDATDYGPACMQLETVVPLWMVPDKTERFMAYVGYEGIARQKKGPDCLNLNLWTPTLPDADVVIDAGTASTPAHPVMVFLHGGGMNQGSNRSAYVHGARLAQKGVVVVNINHRLGTQGFLAGGRGFDGDVLVPNRGIMDILAALQWVQAHIDRFGGDPSRVTLVGESGGGYGVWAVLSSPASEGLVHRAIVHSAAPVMTPIADLEKVSADVLADLGVAPGDVDALAALPDEDIPHTLLSEKLLNSEGYGFLSQTNMPFNGAYGTALIPVDTLPALQAGRAADVDVMIGINKHEARGLSIMVPLLSDTMATKIASGFLAGYIGPDDEARDRVRQTYQTAFLPDGTELEVEEQIQQDAVFRQPNIRAAEARHRHQKKHGSKGRTYLWEFHWESPCCDGEVGAIHGLEMAFAYDNLHTAQMFKLHDPTAQPLATAMSDAWVNFAKTGTPSAAGLPAWPAYDEETRPTMVFDRQSAVVQDIEAERRLFWNEEYARQKAP